MGFCIETDNYLEHKISNITTIERKTAVFVHMVFPRGSGSEDRVGKITKYSNLRIEKGTKWKRSCRVIPIIIGVSDGIKDKVLEELIILATSITTPPPLAGHKL